MKRLMIVFCAVAAIGLVAAAAQADGVNLDQERGIRVR